MVCVACVVEGHGEVEALPCLLRRIAQELGVQITVPQPIRVPKSTLLKPDELEKAVDLGVRKSAGDRIVLVVLDADDDCPAVCGPQLLKRAQGARSDAKVAVVLAKAEFEAWFLAAAPSLAGQRSLDPSLAAPARPEDIRDAKGWLGAHMAGGRRYAETIDQPALAALFDMAQARRGADSFDKLWRAVEWLITS